MIGNELYEPMRDAVFAVDCRVWLLRTDGTHGNAMGNRSSMERDGIVIAIAE